MCGCFFVAVKCKVQSGVDFWMKFLSQSFVQPPERERK